MDDIYEHDEYPGGEDSGEVLGSKNYVKPKKWEKIPAIVAIVNFKKKITLKNIKNAGKDIINKIKAFFNEKIKPFLGNIKNKINLKKRLENGAKFNVLLRDRVDGMLDNLLEFWKRTENETVTAKKKRLIICYIISAMSIITMLAIVFLGLKTGVRWWASEIWLPAMGFESFFQGTACEITNVISAILAVIVFILVFFAAMGEDVNIIAAFFAGYIVAGIAYGLSYLIVRFAIAVIGYVVFLIIFLIISQYTVLAMGLAATASIIVIGRNMFTKKSTWQVIINASVVLGITVFCFILGNKFLLSFQPGDAEEVVSLILNNIL